MADFSAADVKKLRELTGAGMLDCKNALAEAGGDVDKAVEILRVKGQKGIAKRAGRATANGLVAAAEGAMIQLNCETDFVAKNEQFQQLASDIVAHAAGSRPSGVEDLLAQPLVDGKTVGENIEAVSAVIGEKLELGNVVVFDGKVAAYQHKRNPDLPPQIGVLVEFTGDDVETARGAAMQIASLRASYLTREDVPADVVDNERRIAEATAREEGKPEQALAKIVEGRVNGFFKENVLLEQAYVRDNKKSVRQVLDEAGVSLTRFARFEVGA